MSVRLLSKYRKSMDDLTGLSPGGRHVLLIYCVFADNNTLTAYPGTPLLMQMMGHSERQVQRYVQECRERGFLTIVKNRGGRRQYALYRVNLGVPVMDPDKIPADVRADLIRRGLMSDSSADDQGEDVSHGEDVSAPA